MNSLINNKDTVSIDGALFKREAAAQEILICTINVYQYFLGPEYDGRLNWDDAKKWCESLGDGYELPNRLVLLAMCMNKESATNLTENSYYWTSSEAYEAGQAWAQARYSSQPGFQVYFSKSAAYRIRAVRRSKVDNSVLPLPLPYAQERADFGAWHTEKYWSPLFDEELGRFIPTVVQNRWEAYQAGRAAGIRDGRASACDSASRMGQMREDGL